MDYSDELRGSEPCDMDLMEVQVPDNGFPREAWHCDNCGALQYNTKPGHHHPVAGAPMPRFISNAYQRVCSLCYDLYNNARFSLDYWQKLHRDYLAEQRKTKELIDRSTGNRDYFTGDAS